ncbi:MAG TPA: hypothetical protein VFF73_23250 [Planctomycetota bacterium]|nr:hypothetical protein [Planctomycetota bacterium]
MNDWHRLGKSFAELSKRHPFLEDHARLMRILVNTLSADPRLEAVEAGISLSTLTLKPRGSVHWVAVATRGTRYTVAIMDALESAERDMVQCSAEKVVFTILEYLEKLKR